MQSIHEFVIAAAIVAAANSTRAEKSETTPSTGRTDVAETTDDSAGMTADTLAGLKFRGLGPALMSGRICDFAVDPAQPHRYFVAVCSGGLWKTENAGTTWTPVFDEQASYSIGCVTLDPQNPNVVWVGSGENNSQRSVAWGDGVYRSRDGGKNWENLGLKESEHIGEIVVDPRDSNTVYAAAQGPLWRSGGERGLYKTTDGGATWNRALHISDDTGVNEVHMDPRDPDVLYASAYQRRRHVWTLINGGPESAVYKSTDAGATWRKLEKGLPEVDKGRIGMCVSPANPDVVYAIIEAADGKGGVFRSTDRGETWDKRNDFMSSSPQYYNELICDPVNPDRVYFPETFMRVTQDGGKTIERHPGAFRHVDDHALWIDPLQTDHLLVGCDGGIYESYDRGANWQYKQNLPITQFYRVAIDNSKPFYFMYGGTQDNNTIGGPSRTINPAGIANEDWFITVGGDGFEAAVDPDDPNIVYSQWQHGGLVRFDRRSGEIVDIKPREAPGDAPYRWNWDSPLIISPHNPHRLYFGANRLFRSDDRGDSWTPVTADLSRGIDRNALEVMGKIQNVDAVAKNRSTSIYGNTVSLSESPLIEGLIYIGTDDGLIHVTENGGADWRKIAVFPTVPDVTYVSALLTSRHNADRVYAAFDNHKKGDFKPYVLRSDDRGQTWTSIAGDLPERDVVYTLGEDHEKPDLLFAGTEFGVYATLDGGTKWIRLKGGIPTISVRDLEIQRRENDLVLATFGRGFYVLDDYTPLRTVSAELLERDGALFPVKDAHSYMETNRLADPAGKATQGASYYLAPNPPFGAVFTYHLKDKLMTRKEQRKEDEKKAEKAGKPYRYPSIEELRAEDEEHEPTVVLVVTNSAGETVRRVPGARDKGIQRVAWDLRYPSAEPTELKPPADRPPWIPRPVGPMAAPGRYTVTLMREVDGAMTPLSDPQSFDVVPLNLATLPASDLDEKAAFDATIARLQRAVTGTIRAAGEADNRIAHLRKAFVDTPGGDRARLVELQEIDARLKGISTVLRGDQTRGNREEPAPPSINERVENVVNSQWYTTSAPTRTQRDAYRYAGEAFTAALADLRKMFGDLAALETKLDSAGAPWTPGRLPDWQME
ncbi:MAG: glycosyl hydrolase [Phycisphaerales bacterium]|nr:glycosyl hydrolase [Phycisphaerales bacterium]